MTQKTKTSPARRASGSDWRNVVIAVLATLLAVTSALTLRGCREGTGPVSSGSVAEEVRVFDVVLDRENRAFLDLLFDQPLGAADPGVVLGTAPATLDPPLAGSWRWRSVNALRFEPSGGFPVASQYRVELIPERLLGDGQTFAGDRTLTVRTDQLLVEGVQVQEEPVLDGEAQVTFQGEMRFNYAVDPEVLAPLIYLEDSLAKDGRLEVQLENPYWTRQVIQFRTAPVRKTPAERAVTLHVDASLTPAAGNAPLAQAFSHAIPVGSSERLVVRTVAATPGASESSIELELSSPVAASVVRQYLKVKPDVRYRLSASRNRVTLTGAFAPGGSYEVAVAAGLPAQDDAVLQEPFSKKIRLADLPASLDFQSQGLFLSASGLKNLAVESVNVQQATVSVDRVFLNNLFPLIEYGGRLDTSSTYSGAGVARSLGNRLMEKTIKVAARRNETKTTVLSLDDLVEKDQRGLLRIQLSKPGAWEAQQRWVLLTDLGAVAKKGQGEVFLWVASSKTLAPAAGAKVRLLSDQNQVLAEGRTDAQGFWRFRDAQVLEEQRPFLITIEQGQDFTFVYLDRMAIDTVGLDVGGAPPLGKGYTAFLYGERDIYRPGETLEGLAVVRRADLSAPPSMPATLVHRDPQGRERSRKPLSVDERGLAELSLDLLPAALTGRHSLELVIAEKTVGQYRFQVEEFIPDRIEVRIRPSVGEVLPGTDLAYRVESSYLFGPPAADLAVETRVRLERAFFAPAGFPGFTFGDPQREFENREVFVDEGRLDAEGHRELSPRLVVPGEAPSSLAAVITARVQEAGGRGVTARTRVPVHPYPYYLGLRRLEEGYPEPGDAVELEVVAVTPDGKEVPSGALQAELILERWNTVLRRTPEGNFRYESTREEVPVSGVEVPASNGRARFTLQPRDYGRHRLVVTDPATGASAAVQFYVSGWGYAPWAIENPARLQLELDKDEYSPGDVAKVLVRAPFSGTLLLSVERGEIYETQVHLMAGNTAEISLPIRETYRPNAYVTGTLVRSSTELEPGEVARAFGAVSLAVDQAANRLDLKIQAPEEVRSQSKLVVEVKARPGAVITVAAVDEGVLQLIAQKTAEPFEFFYRKLALGVTSYDTFSLLFPEVASQPTAGGGEGGAPEAQYVRTEGLRRVRPVAFWSGPVETNSQGVGRVELDLPEFQGALRVMAVGVDGKRFGSEDLRVRVRDPVVLLPTLPRTLSFGERVQVPVTVRNDTGKAGTFAVRLGLAGPGNVADGNLQTVEIADASDTTVYFTVETKDTPGELSFVLTAEGNGEATRSTGFVGVRSDLPAVATSQAGAMAEKETALAFQSDGLRPGTERRRLQIGSVPLVQLGARLSELLRYPYGCLEQTVSRAFPLLYLGDLARQLEPELLDPEKGVGDPESFVEAAIGRVGLLQIPGGGFSLWPRGRQADPWVSIYTAHFLVEAQRAGYTMGSLLHDDALSYLSSQVRAKSTYGAAELERLVYGLYVLARAGRADLGTMDFLRTKHLAKLAPQSRSLLAASYGAVGDQDAVRQLTAQLGEVEAMERSTGENYSSTLRNRALLLLALLDADPESPRIPQVADRLAREARTPYGWTTQETSFALLALGQLFRRQAERGPFSGKVYAGEKLLGSFTHEVPATFSEISGTVPLRVVMEGPYEAGAAFFSLTTRGVPTDEAFRPVAEGLEIERRLLTRDKGIAVPDQVQQGDLVVLQTRVRSVTGPVQNVVVESLLPSGLEVENPRLESTETLPWISDATLDLAYYDLRDDRVLVFTDLPANSWRTYYTVLRAVAPGSFRLPPVHAEAMYDPARRATGQRGQLEVEVRR